VQIGSYSEIGNARQVETQLRALGQPVVVAPIDTAQGVLYRVRAGPYASEDGAGTAHARIVAEGYADARLIKP
jgi:DedD protein